MNLCDCEWCDWFWSELGTRLGRDVTRTCQHDCLDIVWKFNGGNPWWICGECGARVCGEWLVLWPGVEDIECQCVLPVGHEEECRDEL